MRRIAARELGLTLLCVTLLAGCGGSKKVAVSAAPSPKWTLKLGSIRNPLAIGLDGTLYALPDSAVLTAIDSSGKIKWTQQAGVSGRSVAGPAVGTDGAIYVLGFGKFMGFNPDGSTRIEKPMSTIAGVGMALTDNRVYVECLRTGTCAWTLDQGMDLIWKISTRSFVSPPIIETDGTVVLTGDSVMAVDGAGSSARWAYPSHNVLVRDPDHDDYYDISPTSNLFIEGSSAGKDGATYVTGAGLMAFDVNGQQKWILNFPSYPGQQPVVAADGTVYFASHNQHFYAVQPDGTIRWSLDTTAMVAQPLLGSEGTIFFTDYKTLRAVAPDGKEKWKADLDIEPAGAATLSDERTLYVASRLGTLYAFPVGETLMQSPWPKFQANVRNSGQANP